MLIKTAEKIKSSDITSHSVYKNRRRFIQQAGGFLALAGSMPSLAFAKLGSDHSCRPDALDKQTLNGGEEANSLYEISHYNNYYEFSTSKEAVAVLAQDFITDPWSLSVEGAVETPLRMDVDALIKRWQPLDRIYRLRCVEGWSMVIPWQGIPLCEIIKAAMPTSKARYVEFVSANDPLQMTGLSRSSLPWPYREALTIGEATHPLTLLATGMYGEPIPNQNGAPLRLVVPWKYGFKSAKAITKIILREDKPTTSWMQASPREYGFFANVNPKIPHPRWSQRRENRIGELKKRKTLMFNGYAEEVAHLYSGMDLKKNF